MKRQKIRLQIIIGKKQTNEAELRDWRRWAEHEIGEYRKLIKIINQELAKREV